MKGTGFAFFSYGLDGRHPCGFLRKDDLMSGLDDHNAEEICFSMAPVRAVTRAATGFSNFPTGSDNHSQERSGKAILHNVCACFW
jgi:hypothetical protein